MKLVECVEGKSYTKGDGTTFVAPCTGIFVDFTAKEDGVYGEPPLNRLQEALRRVLEHDARTMETGWVQYTPPPRLTSEGSERRIYGRFVTGNHGEQAPESDPYVGQIHQPVIYGTESGLSFNTPATITLAPGTRIVTENLNNITSGNGYSVHFTNEDLNYED